MEHSAQYPWARDLWLAFHTLADNFNAQLFRLIAKADHSNRRRLAKGFPDVVSTYEAWRYSPCERAFMDRYQVLDLLEEPERSTFLAQFPPNGEKKP